jgi:hypothetical protein
VEAALEAIQKADDALALLGNLIVDMAMQRSSLVTVPYCNDSCNTCKQRQKCSMVLTVSGEWCKSGRCMLM